MTAIFRTAAGVLGWATLLLQYVLVVSKPDGPDLFTRTVNFFSFFTILTNILVALALTLPALIPHSAPGQFFARPSVRTAITCYITIVMAVVYFILRHIQDMEGLDLLCDIILHYVMPALFIIDWLCFVPKGALRLSDTPKWLIYPFVYLVWTFIHGAYSGFYPYPFLNAGELGVARVLQFEAVLLVVFLAFGLVFVFGGRILEKRFRP